MTIKPKYILAFNPFGAIKNVVVGTVAGIIAIANPKQPAIDVSSLSLTQLQPRIEHSEPISLYSTEETSFSSRHKARVLASRRQRKKQNQSVNSSNDSSIIEVQNFRSSGETTEIQSPHFEHLATKRDLALTTTILSNQVHQGQITNQEHFSSLSEQMAHGFDRMTTHMAEQHEETLERFDLLDQSIGEMGDSQQRVLSTVENTDRNVIEIRQDLNEVRSIVNNTQSSFNTYVTYGKYITYSDVITFVFRFSSFLMKSKAIQTNINELNKTLDQMNSIRNEYESIQIERNKDPIKTMKHDFYRFMKIRIRDVNVVRPYPAIDFDHQSYNKLVQDIADMKSYQNELYAKRPYFYVMRPGNVIIDYIYSIMAIQRPKVSKHNLHDNGAIRFINNYNDVSNRIPK